MKKITTIIIFSILLTLSVRPIMADGGFTIRIDGINYDQSNINDLTGVNYDVPSNTLTFNESFNKTINYICLTSDLNIIVNCDLVFETNNGYCIDAGDNKAYLKIASGKTITATNISSGATSVIFYKGSSYHLYSYLFKKENEIDRDYITSLTYDGNNLKYVDSNTVTISNSDVDVSSIPSITGTVTRLNKNDDGTYSEIYECDCVNGFVKVTDVVSSVSYDESTFTYTVEFIKESNQYLYIELLFPLSEEDKTISYTFLDTSTYEPIDFPDGYYNDYDRSAIVDTVDGDYYDVGGTKYRSYYMGLAPNQSDDNGKYIYKPISLKLTDGTNIKYINVKLKAETPANNNDPEPEVPINNNPEPTTPVYKAPNTAVR